MGITAGHYDERVALEPWDYGGLEHVNRAPYVVIVDDDGTLLDADDVMHRHVEVGQPFPSARDLQDPECPQITSVAVSAQAPVRALFVHPRRDASIRVRALGCMDLEEVAGCGRWLGRRPGLLLKFLMCRRYSVIHAQEIAQALWGHAGFASSGTVRQCVHELREKLEVGQPAGSERLVVTRQCGYALSPTVAIDADDFAVHVRRGIAAADRGRQEVAIVHLRQALSMYHGDFLADEPEAEWALAERERLREHMEDALDALAGVYLAIGCRVAARACLTRLAVMRPLDEDPHRRLLALLICDGRHSQASRCYEAFSERLWRVYLKTPTFTLSDFA